MNAKIERWMKSLKRKDISFVKKWLIKELKELYNGIQCCSHINNRYKVKYKVFWEVDNYGSVMEYKFFALKSNIIDSQLVEVMNSSSDDEIFDLLRLLPEYAKVDSRIKLCCRVSDLLESIDEDYSWNDTMEAAGV